MLRRLLLSICLASVLSGCESVPIKTTAPIPEVDANGPGEGSDSSLHQYAKPKSAEKDQYVEAAPVEPAAREPGQSAAELEALDGKPESMHRPAPPESTGSQKDRQMQTARNAGEPPINMQQTTAAPVAAGFIPGSAAYQIPVNMVEGQSSPVDLWIDPSITVDELRAQLHNFLTENALRADKRTGKSDVKSKSIGTTQIVGKEVLIGKKMYAELIGPDFEITPAGPKEEAYIKDRPLRWSWLVKPKHDGKNGLPLEIRVMADPGEGQTPVETIREVVIVHAREKTWKERFEELDWWIKLISGGGISSVILLLWKKSSSRGTG